MTGKPPLLAFFLLAAMGLPSTVRGQVHGRITDADSREPVVGALVRLSGQTTQLTTSTTDGIYVFTRPMTGDACIHVDSPGYHPASVCIRVSTNISITVDLPLRPRPVVIEPLIVAPALHSPGNTAVSIDSVRPQRIPLLETQSRALAGGLLSDLTHQSLDDHAGGRTPHTLYIWGSSAERGRVLLDGATINAPLHLGALMPPLDPDVIGTADLRSGGISPRYDGGTNYIMDFTTRTASDEARFWGELDPFAARIGAESPINGHGRVIVSARRVNDEVIEGFVSPGFGYGYGDALARIDLDVGRHAFHLTGLATHESVHIPRDISNDHAAWDNRVATLGWRHQQGAELRSATFTMSRGIADLPLLSATGGHLEATLDRYSALAQRRWSTDRWRWDAGAELEHLVFSRHSRADEDPRGVSQGPVECTELLPCSRSATSLASAFAQVSVTPAQSAVVTLGARTMYDLNAGQLHVLPRASLTLLPSDDIALRFAAGRFSQAYVRPAPLPSGDGGVRPDRPIEVAVTHATHLEFAVVRDSAKLNWKAGAYMRLHEHDPAGIRARVVPGADLLLEYVHRGGVFSVSYGISGNPQRAVNESTGNTRIQQLSTAAYRHTYGRWRLDLSAAYGSGLPLTSIVLEQPTQVDQYLAPENSPRPVSGRQSSRSADSYVRVDASVSAEWFLSPWGRDVRLVPYARIINALSQRESLFYYQNTDSTQSPRPLASLPAVPVLGVRWRF